MKHFLTLGFAVLVSVSVFSNNIKVVVSNAGKGWSVASNWDPYGVPEDGDMIIVPIGKTISIKGSLYSSHSNIKIVVYGTLDFNASGKLMLGSNSSVELVNDQASITTDGTASEVINMDGTIKYKGKSDGFLSGPMYANNSTGASPYGFLFGVLAVRMTNVGAVYHDNHVLITWTTAADCKAGSFIVEKKQNNAGWIKIKTLNTALHSNEYQVVDDLPVSGNNYYRVTNMEPDGKAVSSRVVFVNITPRTHLKAMPNPARSFVTVSFAGRVSSGAYLQMVSMSGKLIKQKPVSSGVLDNERIDLSGNSPGIYFVILRSDDRIISTSMVSIQK